MNSSVFVVLFACLAAANAGVFVTPGSSRVIQGASSRTTIAGADGSVIHSERPGGSIVENDVPSVVTRTAPILAASPALAYSAPAAAAYSVPVAYSPYYGSNVVQSYAAAPVVSAYSAAPLAYSGAVAEDTVVAGPSGTIATSKTVNHPTLFAAPQVYGAGVRYVL